MNLKSIKEAIQLLEDLHQGHMGLGKPVSPNSTPNLLGLSLLKLRISEGMTHTPVQTSIQTKQFKVPALDCEKYPRPLTDEQLTSFYQFLWDITQILIQCNTISEQQKSYKASKETLLEKNQETITSISGTILDLVTPLNNIREKEYKTLDDSNPKTYYDVVKPFLAILEKKGITNILREKEYSEKKLYKQIFTKNLVHKIKQLKKSITECKEEQQARKKAIEKERKQAIEEEASQEKLLNDLKNYYSMDPSDKTDSEDHSDKEDNKSSLEAKPAHKQKRSDPHSQNITGVDDMDVEKNNNKLPHDQAVLSDKSDSSEKHDHPYDILEKLVNYEKYLDKDQPEQFKLPEFVKNHILDALNMLDDDENNPTLNDFTWQKKDSTTTFSYHNGSDGEKISIRITETESIFSMFLRILLNFFRTEQKKADCPYSEYVIRRAENESTNTIEYNWINYQYSPSKMPVPHSCGSHLETLKPTETKEEVTYVFSPPGSEDNSPDILLENGFYEPGWISRNLSSWETISKKLKDDGIIELLNKNPEKFRTLALEIAEKTPNHINDLRRLVMDENSHKYDSKLQSYLNKPEFIHKSIQHAKYINKAPIAEQVKENLDASIRSLSKWTSKAAHNLSSFVEEQRKNNKK